MKFKLEFDEVQLRTVLSSLQELPYKTSSGLINAIIAQVQEQERAEAAEAEAKKAPLKPDKKLEKVKD